MQKLFLSLSSLFQQTTLFVQNAYKNKAALVSKNISKERHQVYFNCNFLHRGIKNKINS